MTLSTHAIAVGTFVPMLTSLSEWLDKGAEHARSRGLDPETLGAAQLAPDMFTLAMQVMLACHHARDGTARLTGRPPPAFGDADPTLGAMKARIADTIADLQAIPAADFDGAEDRPISMDLTDALVFQADGLALLRDWSIPHFYFHAVTAYDILRHEGVGLGKRDYLSQVNRHVRPKA